jgi:predicted neuraminidase
MTDTLKRKKQWLAKNDKGEKLQSKTEKSQHKSEKSHPKTEKNQVKYYFSVQLA